MQSTRPLKRWVFASAVLAIACGALRLSAPDRSQVPRFRSMPGVPWRITPRYDLPEIATGDELVAVLARVQPPCQVNTNNWVHALRLWGTQATFDDPARPSGRQLREFLTDDRVLRHWAGSETPPLIFRGRHGWEVRSYDRDDPAASTASVHPDDLLATLGETQTPLGYPLVLREGQITVGQMLDDTLGRYHTNQMEFEWSAISYARYVFPQSRWVNDYGQTIRLNDLLDELIDLPPRQGVCSGTHRLEALVVLLGAAEQAGGLSPRQYDRIYQHLKQISGRLIASQHVEGYWNKSWSTGEAPATDDSPLAERILATGHHLEWLALAPDAVLPPRETILRAGRWLVRAMLEVDDEVIAKEYGPFSHGARALCLWRCAEPQAVWSSRAGAGSIATTDGD